MAAKDSRVKRTNEIFNGIKYIKMCGSENQFMDIVYFIYNTFQINVIT
jgi:hypothetical protein